MAGQHGDVIRGDFKLFGLYRVWVFHSIAFLIVCYRTETTDKAQKLKPKLKGRYFGIL